MDNFKYVIISPVRNEEKFVKNTIQSVLSQTILPSEWIIVNDGSTDQTEEIIRKNIEGYPWIKLICLNDRGYYLPGSGIVNVFYQGYQHITQNNYDFIVKLDCDLSFEKEYFEKIFLQFSISKNLGIASGSIYLKTNRGFVAEKSQEDHPWGASKIYRRECFQDIGGIKRIPGWDLADILSAQMKGWETKCFREYKLIHYKQTGSKRKGFGGDKFLLGQFQYRFGYTFSYSVLKGLYRLLEKPYFIGGMGIIVGYIFAFIKNEDKIFDNDMIEFLRKKQRKFLVNKLIFWKVK